MLHSKSASVGYSTSAGRRDHVKLEAEQAVLGGLMLKNERWPAVATLLTAADFHRHDHRLIFSAIHALATKGAPFDTVTLADYLEESGALADVGGFPYLGILARDTPSAANVLAYARIVKRASLQRQRQAAYASDNHALAAAITAALKALESGADGQPRLLTIKEVMARPIDYDWLITGLIERQQSGVMWGDTGTLKTLQALDMACRIATGTPWNGCETTQGGVLYIVGEGAGRGITRRLKAWQIKNGINIEDAPIIIREVPTALPTDTALLIADTKAFLESHGWTLELVILDTLSRTMDGDENSQSDFGAYQRALDQVRAVFGCATLFLHHSGHADKDRPRGASSITCNADVSLATHTAPGDTVKLSASKLKDAGKPADMFFRLAVVELGEIGKNGQPITGVTLMAVAPPVEATKAMIRPHERQALAILEKNGPLRIGDWRALFRDAWMKENPDTKGSTFRMRWTRIKENLQAASAITVRGDTVSVATPPANESVTTRVTTPVTNASHVTDVTPPMSQQSVTSVTHPFKGCDAVTPVVTVASGTVTGVANPLHATPAATTEEAAEPTDDLPSHSSQRTDTPPAPPAMRAEGSADPDVSESSAARRVNPPLPAEGPRQGRSSPSRGTEGPL